MGNTNSLRLITNCFSGRTFKKVGTHFLVKREKLKVKRDLQKRKNYHGIIFENQYVRGLQGAKSANPPEWNG